MRYILTRDVTQSECPWLIRDFKNGEVVLPYEGITYGCISGDGVACSLDGSEPFFELPENAVDVLRD